MDDPIDDMLNAQNDNGQTPLHTAAADGRPVMKLIELGANILAKDRNGRCPLHLASENGHLRTAEQLLEIKAELLMEKKWTAIFNLQQWFGYSEAVHKLSSLSAPLFSDKAGGQDDPAVLKPIKSRLPEELLASLPMGPSEEWSENGQLQQLQRLLTQAKVEPETHRYGPQHRSIMDLVKAQFLQPEDNILFKIILGITAWLIICSQTANMQDMNEQTALHRAARNGMPDVVRVLLTRGAEIKIQDIHGQTALHLAANAGHRRVIDVLLEIKNDTVAAIVDKDGRTALHMAAETDNENVVSALIRKHQELVHIQDNSGQTALFRAVGSQRLATTNRLLKALGAAQPTAGEPGKAALQVALQEALQLAVNGEWQKGVELLSEQGVDLKTNLGQSALQLAVHKQWETSIKVLSVHGVDLNTEHGQKALQQAVVKEWGDTIQILTENGVHVQGESGQKALLLAVEQEWEGLVELLLDKVIPEDWQQLLESAVKRRKDVFSLVVQRADVEMLNKANVLWEAADNYDVSRVKLLVERGADMNATRQGETVLHRLADRQKWETVRVLIEKGANLDQEDNDGQTVLRIAVEHSEWETIYLLVQKGAKVSGPDGSLALDQAREFGKEEIVNLLVENGATSMNR